MRFNSWLENIETLLDELMRSSIPGQPAAVEIDRKNSPPVSRIDSDCWLDEIVA